MGTEEPPVTVPSAELPEATAKATAHAELADAEALAAAPVASCWLPCLARLMADCACAHQSRLRWVA